MSTPLTGYLGNVLGGNDTYPLKMIDPVQRIAKAVITITRNNGYDGVITVEGRARGSSQGYQPTPYQNNISGAQNAVATLTSAASEHSITVDVSAQDIALVVSGQSTGTATVDVAMAEQA